jgi:hypothetical protein
MHFPVVTIPLADVLPVAIIVAVQSIRYKGVGSDPAHLFIDVLAKVRHVQNAASIVQMRVHQVCPEAFEYRECNLSFIHFHDSSTANNILDNDMVTALKS